MENPSQRRAKFENYPQSRELRYLVVDTEGGYLAKNISTLLTEMGFEVEGVAVVDQPGVGPEQLQTQIDSSGMFVCANAEAESRIWALLGDTVKPVISLGLTSQDQYEASSEQSTGSAGADNARVLKQIESKLIEFGFNYPKTT